MAFDPERVPREHADLFYHGRPAEDGSPRPLSDAEWDAQKAEKLAGGVWPFVSKEEE